MAKRNRSQSTTVKCSSKPLEKRICDRIEESRCTISQQYERHVTVVYVPLNDEDHMSVLQKYIIDEVPHKWKRIATALGFSFNKVEAIESDCSKDDECLLTVFGVWLRRSAGGTGERTLQSLYRVLVDCECRPEADNLLKHFQDKDDRDGSSRHSLSEPSNVVVSEKLLSVYSDSVKSTYKRMRPVEVAPKVEYVELRVVEEDPFKKTKRNAEAFLENMCKANCEWVGSHGNQTIPSDRILAKDENRVKLIFGAPGIGKTTLLRHLTRRYAFGEVKSDFDLVLLFPLREKRISTAKSLPDLLAYYGKDTDIVFQSLSSVLQKSKGSSILFLFDGLDEAVHLLKEEDSCLNQLLHGDLLPEATIVITSRPGSCSHLSQLHLKCFEIQGFNEIQIKEFVNFFLKQDESRSAKFFSELRCRPDLNGAVYIPVNLFILCSVFEHEGQSFPSTITSCYQSFFLQLIFRYLREKKGESHLPPIASFNDLPREAVELVRKLSQLCLNGLLSDPKILVFDEKMVGDVFGFEGPVPEDFDCMGLLNVHLEEVAFSTIRTYNLQHATLQEFLSAEELKCLPEEKQVRFWSDNMDNPSVAMAFRFYCGLTGLKSKAVQKAVFSRPLPNEINLSDQSVLFLFHSLFESQNISFTEQVVQRLQPTLYIDASLSSFDWMALSHCLSKCSHLQEIIFILSNIPINYFLKICQKNPFLVKLTIAFIDFSINDAKSFVQSVQSLEMLRLLVVTATSLSALAEVFSLKKLKKLTLFTSDNFVQPIQDEVSLLRSKVKDNNTLKELELGSNAVSILECVSVSRSIEKLTLYSYGGLKKEDVAQCVSMPQLVTLHVKDSHPLPLLEAIRRPLKELIVTHPFWSKELDMSRLTSACSQVNIETLQMELHWSSEKDEMIITQRATAVAKGLSQNNHLKRVALKGVPESMQVQIRQTLQTNHSILSVDFSL